MERFGEYMRKQRVAKDLTLREVSKETKIGVTLLHYIERGKIERPKMQDLKTLAAYYGLPEDDVILKGGRLPSEVYFRILKHPELINVIKNYKA